MSKVPPVEGEIVKGEITESNKYDFIPEVGGIIKSGDAKYATITINKQAMKYLYEGLAKYRAVFKTDSSEDIKAREEITKLVDELNKVNDILNEEVIIKTIGLQEPNPVKDTEGTTEEPTL